MSSPSRRAPSSTDLARKVALVLGPLVAVAEVARRWEDATIFPKSLDDVAARVFLVLAAYRAPVDSSRSLFGAWLFASGSLTTVLLTNIDYLLRADPKGSNGFTIAILALLALSLSMAWSLRRAPTENEDKVTSPPSAYS